MIASPSSLPVFFTAYFPWILVVVGAGITTVATKAVIQSLESRRWQRVDGTILSSRLETTDSGGDYPVELFVPVIEYQYTAYGAVRIGSRISLGEWNPAGRAKAETVLTTYPRGRRVHVYISPHDPALVILEPGLPWSTVMGFLTGVFLIFAGFGLLLFFKTTRP